MTKEQEITGLTHQEAASRLKKDGFNELPTAKPKTLSKLIVEIVKEPMIFLLLSCSTIYYVMGDIREGIMLSISVFGVMGITIYQEKKTEKSLDALRNLSSPRALVIRDGVEKRIAGREVVVGDMLVLREGDRVPADAVLIEASNFFVDESLLTGESRPVEKTLKNIKESRDNMSFSGSMVVRGHAIAEVTATATNTEIGKIGKSLHSIKLEHTKLQKEVSVVIKFIAAVAISLSILLAIIYYLTRGDLLNGFLAGLTMAMGILPEEFPIVLTLFLTMGAWRLAENKVLARRAATIETLGGATVLCVDKTGTLTKNKMSVGEIYCHFNGENVEDEIIRTGILASQQKPFDPMELAFLNEGETRFKDLKNVYGKLELAKEYPVEDKSLSVVHIWKTGESFVAAAKGAPETILDLCHFKQKSKDEVLAEVEKMAKKGYRVLALARGNVSGNKLPADRHEIKFEFLGLVGLADPIRPEIKNAVAECDKAGIRVIMITGDYPDTARSIAAQIDLESPGGVLTGAELEELNEKDRRQALKDVNIFSRVTPNQKLLIVNALKENGEVVAMTGDGVNDAPALKSATIGIAMGLRGTDVAREASSLVLLDDNFHSIVGAVRLGRRIYENLQKAMIYLFAVHVPIVALSLFPVLFGWPLVLLPAHIVILELIIDPACTLIFEAEKEDESIMERKPRKLSDNVFNLKMIAYSLVQGFLAALVTVFSYGYTLSIGWETGKARSFAFLTLVLTNLLLILVNLSKTEMMHRVLFKNKNKSLVTVLLITLTVMAFILNSPVFMPVFKFGQLSIVETTYAFLTALLAISWVELAKFFRAKRP